MIELSKKTLDISRRINNDVHEIIGNGDIKPRVDKISGIEKDKIFLALKELSVNLANSYTQVKIDIEADNRISWAGTAHEIREILATLLRTLAPDEDVISQSWFKQESEISGPTQKQRVQYILQQNKAGKNQKDVVEQVTGLDDMISSLVRSTYSRASDAAHRFKERQEVLRILRYFEAFAYDLLNL